MVRATHLAIYNSVSWGRRRSNCITDVWRHSCFRRIVLLLKSVAGRIRGRKRRILEIIWNWVLDYAWFSRLDWWRRSSGIWWWPWHFSWLWRRTYTAIARNVKSIYVFLIFFEPASGAFCFARNLQYLAASG